MSTCRDCRYLIAVQQPQPGAMCARNPPVPMIIMQQVQPTPANPNGVVQTMQSVFPPVNPDATWCGNYVQKPQIVAT